MSKKEYSNKSHIAHYTLNYNNSLDSKILSDLKILLENAYNICYKFFDLTDDYNVNVNIYDDKENYKNSLEIFEDDITPIIIKYRELNILQEAFDYGNKYSYQSFLDFVYMKIVDIFILESKNDKLTWLNYGLSGLFANSYPYSFVQNNIYKISKDEFHLLISDNEEYLNNFKNSMFAFLLVKFLKNRYGLEKLKEFYNKDTKNIFDFYEITNDELYELFYTFLSSDDAIIPNELNINETTTHFKFYYDKTLLQGTLDDLKKELEDNYKRITSFFDIKKEIQVKVCIYPNVEVYHKLFFNRKYSPSFIGSSTCETINVVNPNKALDTHSYNDAIKTLLHEFVHFATHFYENYKLLPFISEGVALYLGNPRSKDRIKEYYLENGIAEESIFSDNYRDFQENGGYIYSQTIIEFIVKNFNRESLISYIRNSKSNIYDILKTTKDDLILSWKEYLLNNYL